MQLKYAGAAYLVYLGIQMLRSHRTDGSEVVLMQRRWGASFETALLSLCSIRKTAIFFSAFLLQFLSADESTMSQGIVLGSLFVAIAAMTDSLYALAAGAIAPALRGSGERRIGRRLGGGMFVGLGIFTALSNVRGVE